ncbi:hypothetical protein MUP00_12520, partial [Candidatus Bathyarchaeota archaeon]|nr:hypothetical protein [Candidatus Bathyarchaeota archaeon]
MPFTVSINMPGLRRRIRLRLLPWLGPIKTGYSFFPYKLLLYLDWCSRHGRYYLDYLHSWDNQLECPHCLLERLRAIRSSIPQGQYLDASLRPIVKKPTTKT